MGAMVSCFHETGRKRNKLEELRVGERTDSKTGRISRQRGKNCRATRNIWVFNSTALL